MSIGSLTRSRLPGGVHPLVVPAALLAGVAVSVGLLALPAKVEAGLVGAFLLAAVAVMTGQTRSVLIFVSVLLIAIDVKTFQFLHPHLGGAPGLVISVQMILLVPLAAIAVAQRLGVRDPAAPLTRL